MQPHVLWLLGPTSSGKTTIAEALVADMRRRGEAVIQYDGDEVRDWFGPGHGFAAEDRLRVVSTLVDLANKAVASGQTAVVSALTAHEEARQYVRDHVSSLITVSVTCAPETCADRDPKGLYAEAKAGRIDTLIGYNVPYEPPVDPDLMIDTDALSIDQAVATIRDFLGPPSTLDYDAIWARTEDLPWCLLLTTGRTGSDFFQSLLDFHPEIFVFNGPLYLHRFWKRTSRCVQAPDGPVVADLVDEFLGAFLHKFKSHYDYTEKKGHLGEDQDQSIDIDLDVFRGHMAGLLADRDVTSRAFLRAVYVAYALCLGQDVMAKKLFFHHEHNPDWMDAYMADFPDSKIISMTRDPRASFVSGVENWRKFNPDVDHPNHMLRTLKRTVEDARSLAAHGDRLGIVRLEDLGDDGVLEAICDWLGIGFDACLKRSTWAGMRWWGDRLSQKKIKREEVGFSKTISTNKWAEILTPTDVAVLDYLIADRLDCYGYDRDRRAGFAHALWVLAAILWPMSYERYYFSPSYLWRHMRRGKVLRPIGVFGHYLARVAFYYGLFLRRLGGAPFDLPRLGAGAIGPVGHGG
jgi:adenylylsulfate kinase